MDRTLFTALLFAPLAAQTSLPVLLTALSQELVEFLEVPHLRHRHEEVEPRELHQAFHHALLVAAPDPAEVVGEQVLPRHLNVVTFVIGLLGSGRA